MLKCRDGTLRNRVIDSSPRYLGPLNNVGNKDAFRSTATHQKGRFSFPSTLNEHFLELKRGKGLSDHSLLTPY